MNEQIYLKCNLADGNTFVTGFNGTFNEAESYYKDFVYVYSDESSSVITSVEFLS